MITARPLFAALALAAVPALAQELPKAPPPAPAQDAQAPLTLDQAIQFSLENNVDVLRARLNVRTAAADLTLARSAILPNLNFNASVGAVRVGGGEVLGQVTVRDPVTGAEQVITQVNPSQTFATYGAGFTVRQLIFDGGRWWNNLEAADKQLAAGREQAEEQRLQTIYTVRRAFYELVRAQRQLAVLKEAAQRSRDQAEQTARLFEGGRAQRADVYAARANRDNDEVNRLGQEARVENARQDLAVAIGRDPSLALNIVEPPGLMKDPEAPPPAEQAVTRALSQRPSLKAYSLQLEALRKQADAARGAYWPTISLNGSYQRNTRSLSEFTASPEKVNNLSGSINLNWNLFGGYETTAQVERARIQVLLTENEYANGKRGIAADVERAVASWSSARTQAQVATQLEDNAVKGLELAKARQDVGLGTQLEVRDAELKVTQARLARVGALVDSHEAEAALRRATGDI